MTKSEIVRVQNALNIFVKEHPNLGHKPIRVDGDMGRLTKDLIRDVKYDIGYLRKNIDAKADEDFIHRLARPNHVEPSWGQTKDAVKRGQDRRKRRRRAVRANRLRSYLKPGVGRFDGVPVAKAAIPVLTWCRQHGWHGRLNSGYRTPAYSESLCYRICGHPSCPGRCAGRQTNHAYATSDRFGLDVSDYVNFGHIVALCPLRPHVHNALPNDLVHFSPSGR